MSKLIVEILGSGTSQGVPVIACDCGVCSSHDTKDKRLRSSVLLSLDGLNYAIDSGPDFRQQMLRSKVQTLEAIIYTHEHKDHIAGMDDVRAFNFKQKKNMRIYCNAAVEKALKREFHYVFSEDKYPGIPKVRIELLSKNTPFQIGNKHEVIPIEVLHYKMPVLGYRIGDFAYVTDMKTISDQEKEKLKGTKVFIINALRREEHISHLNLHQALELIEEINPERAYLTHISHLFGKHEDIELELPRNVFVAYDGLRIELDL